MGACFQGPGGSGAAPRVLAARKGLRLWVADSDAGAVLSTLKFPSTSSLVFASGGGQVSVPNSKKTQFGRVAMFTALKPPTVRV
jgi:hypothetical protein